MTLRKAWPLVAFLFLLVSLYSCAVPQKMWPQKDMPPSRIAGAADAPMVLLASRSSAFKSALVDKLGDMLMSEGFGLQILGIEELESAHIADYDAVVIISTCLAWGFDAQVRSFIERHPRHDKMILVTTSAAGDWIPEKEGRSYDAISSASEPAGVDAVARNVMSSVHAILQELNP